MTTSELAIGTWERDEYRCVTSEANYNHLQVPANIYRLPSVIKKRVNYVKVCQGENNFKKRYVCIEITAFWKEKKSHFGARVLDSNNSFEKKNYKIKF